MHDWPACNHRAHKKSGQILGEEIIAWIESECRGLIMRYGIDAKLFDCRTHLSLKKDAPIPRDAQSVGRVLALPILGGLHHRYVRV